jgi:hypothetical protein
MKALVAEGSSSACTAVGLPIALYTTPLWDVCGVEGERELGQQQEQVREVDWAQWKMTWWTQVKKLGQYKRWLVKEGSWREQSEQEAVQKTQWGRLPHEQAAVSDWSPLSRHQTHQEVRW